jgi:UDP-N-acetylmuramate--alanine ligase
MPAFDIVYKGEILCEIELKVPGEHNITNALAAFATTHNMGIDVRIIQKILTTFTGTKRRFDQLGETTTGVRIVDDYAHHPAEIDATISAARKIPLNKLWVLFQPHTYTRTHALHDDFVKSLSAADEIVLADIYAARENNISGVTSKSIVDGININAKNNKAIFIDSFEKIAEYVYTNAKKGDLVITMGAGDVYEIGEMILELDATEQVKL